MKCQRLIASVMLVCACATQAQDQTSSMPSENLSLGQETYTYLRCYYHTNSPGLPAATNYVWATTSNGSDWFRLPGRWWADGLLKWENMFYSDVSQQQLQAVCRTTLEQKKINSAVVSITAADSSKAFDHTVWSNDTPGSSPVINKIIAFGDSLSDNGNMFNLSSGFLPNNSSWEHGRFSDGKVWVEYLADQLKLPLYDWAVGGAAGDTYYVVPGLLQEVASWQSYMRKAPNYRPENTLFTMLIGANDLVNYGRSVETVIEQQKKALQQLVDSGARNIVVLNLPNLTRAPTFQSRKDGDKIAVQVQRYNQSLVVIVADLSRKYGPGLNIKLFDAFAMVNDILDNPAKYDFSNITNSCLKIDDDNSINYTVWNYTRADCTNSGKYVFWDRVHPTTHTHKVLASKIHEWLQTQGYPLKQPQP